GSDWRHVQPWFLLTNYHPYVDQVILHGLEKVREDPRFVRMGLPGKVVVDKRMSLDESQEIVASLDWHRKQKPSYPQIA
ncbi:AMP nucleosidase, partial [Pseudomonas syringae pv. tagetis]